MPKSEERLVKVGSNKKNKIITAVVITIVVLIIVAFGVYVTGIVPKLATGVTFYKVDENGNKVKFASASVNELNYGYIQVLSSYSQNGGLQGVDLDQVADPATGETYYMRILDSAAAELMNSYLVEEVADEAGYREHSGAARYARLMYEDMILPVAEYRGYPSATTYLHSMYGTGFTARNYLELNELICYVSEYNEYLAQFVFRPSAEDIQAAYDENPDAYERVDFNMYYFAAEVDEEGNADLEAALELAESVEAVAEDSESFRAGILEAFADDEALVSAIEADETYTHYEGFNSTRTDALCEGATEFLFDGTIPENAVNGEEGSSTVILEGANGYYLFLREEPYLNEVDTYYYRCLTLSNDAATEDDATPESIAAGLETTIAEANAIMAQVTDEMSFVDLLKDNTDYSEQIISGGYYDMYTEDTFNPEDPSTLANEHVALGEWLASEDRVAGDMIVLPRDDNGAVSIYYYVETLPGWMATARATIVTASINGWSANTILNQGATAEVNYSTMSAFTY